MTGARLHIPLSECRDCFEPIRFVKLDTGSILAINPGENSAGNVAAMKVGQQLHGFVISREKRPAPRMYRFTPHIATCTAIERPEPPEPHPSLFDMEAPPQPERNHTR